MKIVWLEDIRFVELPDGTLISVVDVEGEKCMISFDSKKWTAISPNIHITAKTLPFLIKKIKNHEK